MKRIRCQPGRIESLSAANLWIIVELLGSLIESRESDAVCFYDLKEQQSFERRVTGGWTRHPPAVRGMTEVLVCDYRSQDWLESPLSLSSAVKRMENDEFLLILLMILLMDLHIIIC